MSEIEAGGKVSHWMWFIFPQITSLGRSRMAITYGINSMKEAEAYLGHPVLGRDYARIVAAVARQVFDRGVELTALMGQPDDTKLVSSLCLIGAVARRSGESAFEQLAEDCDDLLVEAERQGYSRCAATAAFVASSQSASEPAAIESVRVGDCSVAAVQVNWIDAAVDALVLSANNFLGLASATGSAGVLHERLPHLHDELRRNPDLPLRPGQGAVTAGPTGNAVIHAVTVEYGVNGRGALASTSSVAAACEYSLAQASVHGYRSLAFAPMCTRGHADKWMRRGGAEIWLPAVQGGVIGAWLAMGEVEVSEVLLCVSAPTTALEHEYNRRVVEAFMGAARLFS